MNIKNLMQFQNMWKDFTSRHPKFPLFMEAVAQNGITEGTIVEIEIKRPDGKEFSTNMKISKEDMELFQQMNQMQ